MFESDGKHFAKNKLTKKQTGLHCMGWNEMTG